jgi:uncharacterized damage-inducible protein DinB
MTINARWHKAHRMPRNASLEQRVQWHLAHSEACGCREMPATIRAELRRRTPSLGAPFVAALIAKAWESDPWHGPETKGLLNGVSADEAISKPVHAAHSIWELVLHMTAWQREVLARLEGKRPSLPEMGDWPGVPAPSAAAWKRARRDLEGSLRELVQRVKALGAEDLEVFVGATRSRPLGSGVSRAEMLVGILQHNAYHTGQIALLRKAGGLTPLKTGADRRP